MDLQNENQHCLSRPDAAHSYHNPEEALAVLDLVTKLLDTTCEGVASQDDIGIVCSFRRQVQKIRGLLRGQGYESIRVGTVEDYQGQEERILIISTTLSDPSHAASVQELEPMDPSATNTASARNKARGGYAVALEECIKARLRREEAENGGPWPLDQRQTANLVGNVRRFTVALSRAQCLLAVVGCPEVLETSPHWRSFLSYVAKRGSLLGELPSAGFLSAQTEAGTPQFSHWHTRTIFGQGGNEKTAQKMPTAFEHAEASNAGPDELSQAHAPEAEAATKGPEAELIEYRRLAQAWAVERSMLTAELRRCQAENKETCKAMEVMQRKRREDKDDLQCVICVEARKEVAFHPCGHVVLCRTCLLQMLAEQQGQLCCPTCRHQVHNHFFVYI